MRGMFAPRKPRRLRNTQARTAESKKNFELNSGLAVLVGGTYKLNDQPLLESPDTFWNEQVQVLVEYRLTRRTDGSRKDALSDVFEFLY